MPSAAHLLAASDALTDALSRTHLTDLKIKRCLSAKAERSVWLCRYEGQKAVAKLGADAALQIAELSAQSHMTTGAHQVPALLAADAEAGLVVMSFAPGKRLDHALRAHPGRRGQYLSISGAWLATYTQNRRDVSRFGGGFWIKERRAQSARTPLPQTPLIEALIDRMEAIRARHENSPITRARSHGDFCALNLIVKRDVMTGVDIQNAQMLAIAKDVARHLVWLAITQPGDGPLRWGIPAADITSVLEGNSLITEEETAFTLPYFIASELAGRLMSEAAYPEVIAQAQRVARSLLDELAAR